MKYGAHVATRGDFYSIPQRAAAMGAEVVQIFAGNPRSFQVKNFTEEEGEKFRSACQANGLQCFIHMSYLTSYGSPDAGLRQKSIDSYAQMLQNADTLGCLGVVTHLGSHKGEGFSARVDELAAGLVKAVDKSRSQAWAIIENSAGQGGVMGNSLGELAEIYEKTDRHPQIKFCLDTAHLMGAGIEFRTKESLDELLETFDQLIGLENLVIVHLNDSKVDLGERKDRHENIGDGFVGRDGFKPILNHPKLAKLPGVLEVPGLDGKGPDKANIDRLKDLTDSSQGE